MKTGNTMCPIRPGAIAAIIALLCVQAAVAQDSPVPVYPLEILNIKPVGVDGKFRHPFF